MSASLPESVMTDFQIIGYQVSTILEDTSDNDRDRFKIRSIEPIFEKCIEAGAAIIYANTVDRAIEFYKYFKSKSVKTIVYHSRFTESHKKKRKRFLSINWVAMHGKKEMLTALPYSLRLEKWV